MPPLEGGTNPGAPAATKYGLSSISKDRCVFFKVAAAVSAALVAARAAIAERAALRRAAFAFSNAASVDPINSNPLEVRETGISQDDENGDYLYKKPPVFTTIVAVILGIFLVAYGCWNLKLGPQNWWGLLSFVLDCILFMYSIADILQRVSNASHLREQEVNCLLYRT